THKAFQCNHGGLSEGVDIERAVDETVQADHLTAAADCHQLDFARVAGFEADSSPGGDVQTHAIRRGAVEDQAAIDLGEMEVGAHLHRAISSVGDLESPRRSSLVDFDRIAFEQILSGDHGITVWVDGWSRAWCHPETSLPPGSRRSSRPHLPLRRR